MQNFPGTWKLSAHATDCDSNIRIVKVISLTVVALLEEGELAC